MSAQPDHSNTVRRVVLPSGKTIEIVYFADPEDVRAPETALDRPLHVCPECSSGLVYPTAWEEAADNGWLLTLRCPNCEWDAEDVFAHGAVEGLDEELDRGTQALVRDLRKLAHANMEEEVDRFVAALEADAVLPMDF